MARLNTELTGKPTRAVALALILAALMAGAACRKAGAVSQAPPPPEVEVATVEQRDVPIYNEWIGSLDGTVNADIKSQVEGYLLTKDYTEGTFVRKGQLMFQIDPRPFQATLDQAKGDLAKAQAGLEQAQAQLQQAQAQLAQAEANQGKTQMDVDRFTPLVKSGVITHQDYDTAVQANLAAKANVKAAEAGVKTAQAGVVSAQSQIKADQATVRSAELNLGFTRITSPIDGIAGVAAVQVGNLVNPINPNTPALTTVSTVDPIKVWFTVGEQEYLNTVRGTLIDSGHAGPKHIDLQLILSDGSVYPQKGTFFIADRNVDQKTGSIRLAGLFPNPGNVLRPGEYGRVRAIISTKPGALLVPQRAVSELQGSYRVAVVGPDNKVSVRPVKVGDRVDSMWIIEDGLKVGESVVAEGTQKVRPDMVVTPKPYTPTTAAATQGK